MLNKKEISIRLEGIVYRKWFFDNNYYIRIQVYDEHTPVANVRENGLVHHAPHSIIAVLPEEFFQQVRMSQRIKIGGTFAERIYMDWLKNNLFKMRQDKLLTALPEDIHHFTIPIAQLYVDVKSMIAFTR